MQAHLALANAFAGARREGVVEEARAVLQLAEHWPGTRAPTQTIEARVLLGYGLIIVAGQVADGLNEVKTAYAEARNRYGEGHEQTALIANNLGLVCMEAGDTAGALAAYQAAFDSAMQRPDERGPHALGLAHYGLAIALDAARERERALPYFAEAARLFAEANGATTPLALRSRSMRALALTRLGRLDEAERDFASLAAMPFAGADKARHDGRLAMLRSLQGRHDEAVALASSSAEALKTFPSKTTQAQSLANLGVVLLNSGRPEQAIEPLERSIALYREAQPDESRDRAEAIAALELARRRAT
jgi:tetratricopeptide (TPR) repeat protein